MSQDDDRYDDERSRYRTRGERIRQNNLRDPYEAGRQVRTYGPDPRGAEKDQPWQAAHPHRNVERGQRPDWSEQPARYGGGYSDDEELSSRPRGDARYGLDTDAERHFVEGYQNPDN